MYYRCKKEARPKGSSVSKMDLDWVPGPRITAHRVNFGFGPSPKGGEANDQGVISELC
jgi:hypothetical protein